MKTSTLLMHAALGLPVTVFAHTGVVVGLTNLGDGLYIVNMVCGDSIADTFIRTIQG